MATADREPLLKMSQPPVAKVYRFGPIRKVCLLLSGTGEGAKFPAARPFVLPPRAAAPATVRTRALLALPCPITRETRLTQFWDLPTASSPRVGLRSVATSSLPCTIRADIGQRATGAGRGTWDNRNRRSDMGQRTPTADIRKRASNKGRSTTDGEQPTPDAFGHRHRPPRNAFGVWEITVMLRACRGRGNRPKSQVNGAH